MNETPKYIPKSGEEHKKEMINKQKERDMQREIEKAILNGEWKNKALNKELIKEISSNVKLDENQQWPVFDYNSISIQSEKINSLFVKLIAIVNTKVNISEEKKEKVRLNMSIILGVNKRLLDKANSATTKRAQIEPILKKKFEEIRQWIITDFKDFPDIVEKADNLKFFGDFTEEELKKLHSTSPIIWNIEQKNK